MPVRKLKFLKVFININTLINVDYYYYFLYLVEYLIGLYKKLFIYLNKKNL